MVLYIVQSFKKYNQIKKNYLEKIGKYDIIMLCKKHMGGNTRKWERSFQR